jgi:hypothetical protein
VGGRAGRILSVGITSVAGECGDSAGRARKMLIDCDVCAVRGSGCPDCVVTILLGAPPEGVELSDEERAAIGILAEAGLVPPLRLVTDVEPRTARRSSPDPPIAASG